jgi:hypothetical protein
VLDLRFEGSAPYRDRAGAVPPLRWTDEGGGLATDDHGVLLRGFPWLQSDGPAEALATRLQASNAFTLRVICASDDLAQGGPARIVSNSVDLVRRNFTVGQQAANLVVRLRTPQTGPSGARPEVVVPGVFTDNRARDILVTYDGARLLVAVGHSGRVERTEFTPGSGLALLLTSLTIQARELPALGAVFVAVLCFVPGVVLGLLAPAGRRATSGAAWLLVFAVLLEAALALSSGRRFEWAHAAGNGVVGALAFFVGVLVCPPAPASGAGDAPAWPRWRRKSHS